MTLICATLDEKLRPNFNIPQALPLFDQKIPVGSRLMMYLRKIGHSRLKGEQLFSRKKRGPARLVDSIVLSR